MAVNIDKYKALYEYSKDQYNAENERFNRLEDKAVKYLSSITVAVGVYVLLVRWSAHKVIPPSDIVSWFAVISIVVTFLLMVTSWSFIFRSLRLQDLKKMPVGNEITEYFKNNNQAVVYLGLAKKYSDAAKAKESEYNSKLLNVRKGYSEIVLAGWSFVISVLLIFLTIWKG